MEGKKRSSKYWFILLSCITRTHLLISRDGVRDDAEAGGQEVGVTVTDQPTGLAAVDDPEVRVDGNAGGQGLGKVERKKG